MDGDRQKSNKNLIGVIIFLIIIFILFTTNIKAIVNSASFQNNINYIEDTVVNIWDQYLAKSATYLWKNIVLDNINKVNPTNISNILNVGDIQQKINDLNLGDITK